MSDVGPARGGAGELEGHDVDRAVRTDVVYVHAPFCARRCFYCDFAVSVRAQGDPEAWLQALRGELDFVRDEGVFEVAESLRTLYVGGGTPSLLGPGAMGGLAELLGEERLRAPELEWTAEANPESLTPEVAAGWSSSGVNRISLGIQSFHTEALRWMGRLHGAEGPVEAVKNARAAGITNLSVDLIFGLPPWLGRVWDVDLERVLELDVPHVSLYGLTVESRTPLGRAVREGREFPVEEEQYRTEFLRASEVLVAAGYEQYEVSNFARPGFRSRHNGAYWSGDPYLGLGNGAHSYVRPLRRWNARDFESYAELAVAGRSTVAESESLDEAALTLESIWLGLRTVEGVPSPQPGSAAAATVDGWVVRGLAEREDGCVRLSPEGWLLLDELAVELDGARSG